MIQTDLWDKEIRGKGKEWINPSTKKSETIYSYTNWQVNLEQEEDKELVAISIIEDYNGCCQSNTTYVDLPFDNLNEAIVAFEQITKKLIEIKLGL